MPTYEYACQSCGHHVEVYQRFSDEPLSECAICGGVLRKVFHPAGILFKGSGFYATDSRKTKAPASDGGGSGSSAGSERKADTGKGTASGSEGSSASEGGSASTSSSKREGTRGGSGSSSGSGSGGSKERSA